MTDTPPPGWEDIEQALDPEAMVVYRAESIVRAETLRPWSFEHSNPIEDIITLMERWRRGDIRW